MQYKIETIYGVIVGASSVGAALAEAQYIWDALANLHGKGAMLSPRPH